MNITSLFSVEVAELLIMMWKEEMFFQEILGSRGS